MATKGSVKQSDPKSISELKKSSCSLYIGSDNCGSPAWTSPVKVNGWSLSTPYAMRLAKRTTSALRLLDKYHRKVWLALVHFLDCGNFYKDRIKVRGIKKIF